MTTYIDDDVATSIATPTRSHDLIVEILVVDDNPIERLRVGRLIEQDSRFHVSYAENGLVALEHLAVHDVAMVLTDLQMDGMDGLELVRAIRKDRPQIPVILMTAHGSEDSAMEALRVGATDYVLKRRLVQELQAVLARSLRTATAGSRRRLCLQCLRRHESHFELTNDLDLIPPLLELLQDEMARLDRWDSAELMRTTVALDEALRNAVCHGNLEVSSDLREESDRAFHELVRKRSTQAPYRNRRIQIVVTHSADFSRFVIQDEGPGFDTSKVDRPIEPEDLLRSSGRGLLLMKSFMDSVVFNAAGNQVTLIKKRAVDGMAFGEPERPANSVVQAAEQPAAVPEHLNGREHPAAAAGADLVEQAVRVAQPKGEAAGQILSDPEIYKRLLDQMQEAVCLVDTTRRVVYWNEAAERLTGYSHAEIVGRHSFDGGLEHVAMTGSLLSEQGCPLQRSIERKLATHERLIVRHKDGRLVSMDARFTPVADQHGAVLGAVGIYRDATSSMVVESAFRQVREAADRDPLTGLANRRYLDRMFGHFMDEVGRIEKPLSLIMADLDHFKEINDTWGHAVGDDALVQFANTLQKQCRPLDLVARFGGEEFIVLLPGHPLETAVQVAERLRQSSPGATPRELGERRLTASFGVAEALHGESVARLLKRVDAALYRAKSEGRNRVEAASP